MTDRQAAAAPAGSLDRLFPVAACTASACLFLVELFAGKLLLPRFGGAPAVWISCLAFFQVALVGAYLFVDQLAKHVVARRQLFVVAGLFVGACLITPATFSIGLGIAAGHVLPKPIAVVMALSLTVGPAFFVLATLAPLLGHWRGLQADHTESSHQGAYSLYAAGNVGSFAALLAYPWALEPVVGLTKQAAMLAVLFVVVAVATLVGGWNACRHAAFDPPRGEERPAPISWGKWSRWVGLAAIPSSWLASLTTHATAEIAPLPLLWVVPLALYIGSFVVVFSSWGRRLRFGEPAALFVALLLAIVMVGCDIEEPHWVVLAVHAGIFFMVCVCLHGILVDERPAPVHLTTMYLALAVGGACGGLLNSLLAPLIWNAHYEFPLAVAAATMVVPRPRLSLSTWGRVAMVATLALMISLAGGIVPGWPASPLGWLGAVVAAAAVSLRMLQGAERGVAVLSLLLAAFWMAEDRTNIIHRTRTFFGVLRVSEDGNAASRMLSHGSISHGVQLISESRDRRSIPLTYYHPAGPLGSVFRGLDMVAGRRRVGVAGLGIGTIAAYAEPGQEFVFFEIDPAVVRIAEDARWFTFLAECRGQTRIVVDDARLALAREPDHSFDLLVIDAFTGDSVPTHLLTREALALYGRKIVPSGVIAIHISNKFLDLQPVVEALATTDGWMALDGTDLVLLPGVARSGSHWVVLSRSLEAVKAIYSNPTSNMWRWSPLAGPARTLPWTDDCSTVTTCLKR